MPTLRSRLFAVTLLLAVAPTLALTGCSQSTPDASPPSSTSSAPTTLPPITTPTPSEEDIKKEIMARYQGYLEGVVDATKLNPVEQENYLLEWVSPLVNRQRHMAFNTWRGENVVIAEAPKVFRYEWIAVNNTDAQAYICQNTFALKYVNNKTGSLDKRPVKKYGLKIVFSKRVSDKWMITNELLKNDNSYTERACK